MQLVLFRLLSQSGEVLFRQTVHEGCGFFARHRVVYREFNESAGLFIAKLTMKVDCLAAGDFVRHARLIVRVLGSLDVGLPRELPLLDATRSLDEASEVHVHPVVPVGEALVRVQCGDFIGRHLQGDALDDILIAARLIQGRRARILPERRVVAEAALVALDSDRAHSIDDGFVGRSDAIAELAWAIAPVAQDPSHVATGWSDFLSIVIVLDHLDCFANQKT